MAPKTYIIDMDGVLIHGKKALPGAAEFIAKLNEGGHKFLVLTNNSLYTPSDLEHRLGAMDLPVSADHIFSSAMAAANFVSQQKPGGRAFVMGETGLYQALNEVGYRLVDYNPDFVILGEMFSYSYDRIIKATEHILAGVPFIATNPDASGPAAQGVVPACGAVAALLEKATGHEPYFVGKPNPLIMRLALRALGEHSENAVMIGDNMTTDIKVGLESGLKTILVLSGMTKREMLTQFPYRPNEVVERISDVVPES